MVELPEAIRQKVDEWQRLGFLERVDTPQGPAWQITPAGAAAAPALLVPTADIAGDVYVRLADVENLIDTVDHYRAELPAELIKKLDQARDVARQVRAYHGRSLELRSHEQLPEPIRRLFDEWQRLGLLQRVNSPQGIAWEATPAGDAVLPELLAELERRINLIDSYRSELPALASQLDRARQVAAQVRAHHARRLELRSKEAPAGGPRAD
jgi:hypothetical protein